MTVSGHAQDFERDGVVLVPDVLDATACDRLGDELARSGTPGARDLLRHERFSTLARALRGHAVLAALVPAGHVAVQGIRFEKSVDTNWLVAWHQDLGIPVRERVDDRALSGWSIKEGVTYVQPPFEVLEQLVVVRVHVDACTDIDGPLRVVPGSHCRGRLDADQARDVREQLGARVRGPAWLRAGHAPAPAARFVEGAGYEPAQGAASGVRSGLVAFGPGLASRGLRSTAWAPRLCSS